MKHVNGFEAWATAISAVLVVICVYVTSDGAADRYGVDRTTAAGLTVLAFAAGAVLLRVVLRQLHTALARRVQTPGQVGQPITAEADHRAADADA